MCISKSVDMFEFLYLVFHDTRKLYQIDKGDQGVCTCPCKESLRWCFWTRKREAPCASFKIQKNKLENSDFFTDTFCQEIIEIHVCKLVRISLFMHNDITARDSGKGQLSCIVTLLWDPRGYWVEYIWVTDTNIWFSMDKSCNHVNTCLAHCTIFTIARHCIW